MQGSKARHTLHTAHRLAQLAAIGFRHPRSRARVLAFDQQHDSDSLITSLQAARGMPLLLSDQLLLLGGSVSARWACSPAIGDDPDIDLDTRIAETVLDRVGFLGRSEVFLARAILRQAVTDTRITADAEAARGLVSATAGTTFDASTPTAWSPGTARILAAVWLRLLFDHGVALRFLSQRTVVPCGSQVLLTRLDGARTVPGTAVAAALDLLTAAKGDDAAMARFLAHLQRTSAGAESAAAFATAARRVVAGSVRLLDIPSTPAPHRPEFPCAEEPFATMLVVTQLVFVSRVLAQP